MGMLIDLIEFPADDIARARQFWEGLLGLALDGRRASESQGLQSHGEGRRYGYTSAGAGRAIVLAALLRVVGMSSALERVVELGGHVVHPGERWASRFFGWTSLS